MGTTRRRLVLSAAAAVGLLALSACTGAPGGSPAPSSTAAPPLSSVRPAPPEGQVVGTGTVLDTGGDVRFCLDPVMESFPPQCQGLPLDDWTWDGLQGSETSGDTTWGAYAVSGRYDGARYVSTEQPTMLALYNPGPVIDPTGGVDGTTPEAELARVQEELSADLGPAALSLSARRGYVWDDGSLQDAVDTAYGEGVVIVVPALREVG